MIKGVIFDMDGLMFDTERLSTEGWLKCGQMLNLALDLDFINSFKGRTRAYGSSLFKEKFGSDFDYDKARAIRTEYIRAYIAQNGVPVKKGLYELLQFLKKENIPCAVATSTQRDLAGEYLEQADVKKNFAAIVYGDMVERGKPEPDIFLKAAEMLGVDIRSCLVLEDSPAGISAANKAGAKVIGVPDMIPLDRDSLGKLTFCVNNLERVIPIIEKTCFYPFCKLI